MILNLLLIPTFSLYGAAVATLLTDLAAAVQFYWRWVRLELPNLSSIAVCVALSCGSMAAILLVLQWAGAALWVLIPAGMVVYLVMVLLTQILDEEERRLVVRVVNRLGWSRS